MERFGHTYTQEEYVELVKSIEDYTCKPVYVSGDGKVSFHLWRKKIYVLFSWETMLPVTVYRRSWFKKGRYGLIPIKVTKKMKSKEIRLFNKKITAHNKNPGKVRYELMKSYNEKFNPVEETR